MFPSRGRGYGRLLAVADFIATPSGMILARFTDEKGRAEAT
jgi:hypothetical protein